MKEKFFKGTSRPPIPDSIGSIMASFDREGGPKMTPVTGLIYRSPKDVQVASGAWEVYYKTVKFGEFSNIHDAYDHLVKLVDLDVSSDLDI